MNNEFRKFLLACVPDILIALIAMKSIDNEWATFGWTIVILQAVYFLIWLKNTVWIWIVFWAFEKEMMAQKMEEVLRKHRYPDPSMATYYSGFEEYAEAVAVNQQTPCELRVLAATEKGFFHGVRSCGQYGLLLRLESAAKVALTRYKGDFRATLSRN